MYVENLMRHVVYSEEPVDILIDRVVKEVEKIDAGFSFSEAVALKTSKDAQE